MGSRGPKPKYVEYACPNSKCKMYGQAGKGNVVSNGTYKTKNGKAHKLICRTCGTLFCSRTGTVFYDLRTDIDKILHAIELLLNGMSLRGIARTMGVKLDTVRQWLMKAAEHADTVNKYLVRDLKVSKVELDELWSFIKKKQIRTWQKKHRAMVGSG